MKEKDKIYNWILDSWNKEKEANNLSTLSKLLRVYINHVKSKSGMAEGHKEVALNMVEYLERNFEQVSYKDAISVVSTLQYARKNIRASSKVYGAKFKLKGPRLRSRPRGVLADNGSQYPENGTGYNVILPGSMDDDYSEVD